MSAPTIDEMLGWLDGAAHEPDFKAPGDAMAYYERGQRNRSAIRAILEQHRDWQAQISRSSPLIRALNHEAIRAFVERVEKHWPYADHNVMRTELAAIEKEEARYDGNAI
jgi:hypothetical protein